MKTKPIGMLFTIAVTLTAISSSHAAETERVTQMFACNYQPGKDVSDIYQARDYDVEQFVKIGSPDLNQMVSFLWQPKVTSGEFDTIWFDLYPNLNTFGRSEDAYFNSEYAEAAQSKYLEISTCQNSLHFLRTTYPGTGQIPNPLIEAYSCRLNPGKNMTDVENAIVRWTNVLDDLGTHEGMAGLMVVPLISSAPFDVLFFNLHENTTTFASRQSAYLTSLSGQEMDTHWLELLRCESSLWNQEMVIPVVN